MSNSVLRATLSKSVLLILLLSLFTTGCRSRYLITLSNGNRITAVGKPKFDKGYYRYKDIDGQTNYVSRGSVRSIEPQPRGYTEEDPSKPSKR